MKNKVIVKDRDEWSSLANFIGNIIAKYADEIDFDSLPDPDVYLQKRYIYESYVNGKQKPANFGSLFPSFFGS